MMLLKKINFGVSVHGKLIKLRPLFCFSGFLDSCLKSSKRIFSPSCKTAGWKPLNLLKVKSLKTFSRIFIMEI